MEIQNARIAGTVLGGWDDTVPTKHDSLTIALLFEGDGWGQGSGTFSGNVEMFIQQILYVLEATDWSKIKGLPCRVGHENGHIVGMGNIIKERWFFFNRLV